MVSFHKVDRLPPRRGTAWVSLIDALEVSAEPGDVLKLDDRLSASMTYSFRRYAETRGWEVQARGWDAADKTYDVYVRRMIEDPTDG